MTQHTPTPWTCYRNSAFWEFGNYQTFGRIGDVCASSAAGEEFGRSIDLGEANAMHIVKCVNAHDASVESMRSAAESLDSLKDNTGALKPLTEAQLHKQITIAQGLLRDALELAGAA